MKWRPQGWEEGAGSGRGRERWAFDERVLGSDEFVERLMATYGQDDEWGTLPRDPPQFMRRLAERTAERFGLRPADMIGRPWRHVGVRAVLCHVAVRYAGLSLRTVARDDTGRHLRTLNALTGATLFEFVHDAEGLLSQVIEKTGGTDNVTSIQHDGSGNPTAIIGPFGQPTTLAVDANGFLASISNPASESIHMTSDANGLMATYSDPRGKMSTFSYDSLGRLTLDAAPVGATQTLAREKTTSEVRVTRTTTLRRATTYVTENLTGNVQRRTVTAPDGSQSQSTETFDAGTTHATTSDGTASDTSLSPDPRSASRPRTDSQDLTVLIPE